MPKKSPLKFTNPALQNADKHLKGSIHNTIYMC